MSVSHVNAQRLYVDGVVSVPEKGEANIVLKYESGGKDITGYGFTINLPTGLSFVFENGSIKMTYVDGKGFLATYQNGNFGFLPQSPGNKVSGGTGELLILTIKADETLKAGDSFDIEITDASFTDEQLAEVSVPNSTFTVKIVENIVTLDENSTTAPTAAQNVNVLVKRSVKPSNWGTICLPFSMTEEQVQAAFGDGAKLADFDGTEIELDDNNKVCGITVKFVSASSIQANHPYLLQATKEIKYDEGFKVVNVSVNPAKTLEVGKDLQYDEDEDDDVPTSFFYGVYVPTVLDKATYLFLSGNKFYYSNKTTTMKGFRGYFKLQKQLAPEYKDISSSVNVKVSIDDEATYIDGITNGMRVEGVYDLSGRKIKLENGDVTKLQKGVYIINGKKVTIK